MKPRSNAELTRVVNNLLQTMMRLWYYLELWDKDFLSDADGAPNILESAGKTRSDLAQKRHGAALIIWLLCAVT